MKRNTMIAAAVVAVMCGGARAQESALAALKGSVKAEIIAEQSIKAPAAPENKGVSGVYANDSGCTVTVEKRANGSMVYVENGRQAATLGVLDNLKGGDIFAFCSPAAASLSGGVLTLACGEQNNGGYSTRGQARIEMSDGITAVTVRGEVKRALGWKTDTDMVCVGLKPVRAKAAGAAAAQPPAGGTPAVEAR